VVGCFQLHRDFDYRAEPTMTTAVALVCLLVREPKIAVFPGGSARELAVWIRSHTNEPAMVNAFSGVPRIEVDLSSEQKLDESTSAYFGRLISKSLEKQRFSFEVLYEKDAKYLGARIGRPQRGFPRDHQERTFYMDLAKGYPSADQAVVSIDSEHLTFAHGDSGSFSLSTVQSWFDRSDHWLAGNGNIAISGEPVDKQTFRLLRQMTVPLMLNEEGLFVVNRKRATQWMLEGANRKQGTQQLASWAVESKRQIYGALLDSLTDDEFKKIFESKSPQGPTFVKEFDPQSTVHQAAVEYHRRALTEGPYDGDNTWYLEMVRDTPQIGEADRSKPVKVGLGSDGRLSFVIRTTTGFEQSW